MKKFINTNFFVQYRGKIKGNQINSVCSIELTLIKFPFLSYFDKELWNGKWVCLLLGSLLDSSSSSIRWLLFPIHKYN